MLQATLLALGTFAATLGNPVGAPNELIDATDPAGITQVLQSRGYRAMLETDPVGDPMIRSSAAGATFVIYFYECTDNKDCGAIQFYAGFIRENPPSKDVIHTWNAENRYGKAYIDRENDPVIEMDVQMDGGISKANLINQVEIWERVVGAFQQHIAN